MKHHHSTDQAAMFDFDLLQMPVDEQHPLMRIGKELDWDALIEIVGKKYSGKTGRNSKSLRMMIALEIAKPVLRESDRDLVRRLETDIALKLFCGFTNVYHDVPDASSLTKFRKKLDSETLQLLEDASIRTFIRKLPCKRRHQCITDSTCIPGSITFPIDGKLLLTAWRKMVVALEKIRQTGKKVIIRGKRAVTKAAAGFRKKKRHTIEEVQAYNQFLVTKGEQLLALLHKTVASTAADVSEKLLQTIATILAQQGEMLRRNVRSCRDRIVSLHAPMIRPIPRGKEGGRKTEFGKKITCSVIGGTLLRMDRIDDDPFSDTEMVPDAIATHERCFGRKPSEINTDRGGHTPEIHALLETQDITDGVQWKGARPKNAPAPPDHAIKRMRRQRSGVEGKFGTLKTRYCCDRNPYKHDHAHVKIAFALLAMNAMAVARIGGP
ncbi:transposase [Candidatus Peregrinibacteria bacterium]|nr:transposase [Candidatus Peregrinibacteria bacterium]